MHGKVQHPHKMSQHMIPLDNIFHIFASLIRRQIKFAQEAIAHKNEDTTNSQEYVIQTEEDWQAHQMDGGGGKSDSKIRKKPHHYW